MPDLSRWTVDGICSRVLALLAPFAILAFTFIYCAREAYEGLGTTAVSPFWKTDRACDFGIGQAFSDFGKHMFPETSKTEDPGSPRPSPDSDSTPPGVAKAPPSSNHEPGSSDVHSVSADTVVESLRMGVNPSWIVRRLKLNRMERSLTDDDAQRLREAGATDVLIQTMRGKARPDIRAMEK